MPTAPSAARLMSMFMSSERRRSAVSAASMTGHPPAAMEAR
ncbi:MAG: hypothetical protein AB7V42_02845 [Thermoleophilia bacterium]